MVRICTGTLLALALCASVARGDSASDLESATELFERNLAAIESRDRDAYLACYLPTEALVRNQFDGVETGFAPLAASVDAQTWPDRFEARDLRVFAVADGVVYGQYRYRVRYGDDTQEGISERVFVRTPTGWRIAVTTAFAAPAGAMPALVEDSDR